MADSRSNPSKQSVPASLVVVRRKRGEEHDAHHGGAWKIAYADFVTAMMAFFLLMWLLGSVSKYDRQGIEDYFNTPLSTLLSGGKDAQAPRPSVVQGGGRDLSDPAPAIDTNAQPAPASSPAALAGIVDTQKLERLKEKLTAAITHSPSLRAYQDQIRIAITHEGLRIEIVDTLKRPMFASGSSQPEAYATAILTQIGTALDDVENRVSIAGHTDSTPYPDGPAGYSNWELSSDRANAARRALVAGGLREEKLLQVRGLADVLPLDRNVADEPTNRRISILVMNNAAEQAFFRDGGRTTVDEAAGARAAVLPAALARPH
ncbi:flagellar motor protein MotB [Burkholderia sp. MSh2]|uniref:Flagellar motor protein MotB n=1 Tax=Burkholderia paludis TaxID=1506587 RepID=A0A6P2PNN0_9BURK|nr:MULTISPECIES: flagellar motor protein MotB [Burkholderia]KEZ04546.1 flagellar motor protein MotB [Burkholderia sp. MSh2]CAB3764432.1 Motility protein B [Burkholderia paludis]VWC11145.1 flagellar motor protein MotB [Burkholderia paludis]